MVKRKKNEIDELRELLAISSASIEKAMHKSAEAIHALNVKSPLNIAVFGLYNCGKSSLLNALIDANIFIVSDKHEIASGGTWISEIEGTNVFYNDTVGLNADSDNMPELGDINIFAHNINTGELNAQECEILVNLAQKLGTKDFLNSTIFTLTRADSCENANVVAHKVQTQLLDIFSKFPISAPIITSAQNYIKGKKENKQKLVQSSNIDELRAFIAHKIAINKDAIYAKRDAEMLDDFF